MAWRPGGLTAWRPDGLTLFALGNTLAALHARIVRSATTFGRYPNNILCRILDVAGFAMHAVLRIDLQAV